jgi:hypothetical protein
MALIVNNYNSYPMLNGIYSGSIFAMTAQGGYAINQHFNTIKLAAVNPVSKFDVTNSVQVLFDVRKFNEKIGTYANGRFPNDTISLTAQQFVAGVQNASQILSVGAYTSLYSDFASYVNAYFSYANNLTSLFTNQEPFPSGNFDASDFLTIINGTATDPSGAYISNLTGSIQIYNINNIITYAAQYNIFGNRDITQIPTTIPRGFIDGDIILIPQGTTATLSLALDITATGLSPSVVNQQSSSLNRYGDSLFNISSSAALNNITQTVKAPLLIRLTDFTLQ